MTNSTPDELRLLAQADLLLLLARWIDEAPAGPREDDEDLRLLEAHCELGSEAPSLLELSAARASTSVDDWVAEHNRLFEGGVTCPPNETAYVRRDKGVILADIAGFYRAFGFEPAEGTGEKLDHVIVELQFTGLLLVMAGRAAADGRPIDETTTRQALASFASDHLGAWIDLFCERLAQVSPLPCFAGLGKMLLVAWGAVCRYHGLDLPDNQPYPDDRADEGTPYECDQCPTI